MNPIELIEIVGAALGSAAFVYYIYGRYVR